MVAPNNESPLNILNVGDPIDQSQQIAPLSAQDRALLKALHAFVAPRIGLHANQTFSHDVEQQVSEIEGATLITELKQFMTRIINGSQQPDKIKIEVGIQNKEPLQMADSGSPRSFATIDDAEGSFSEEEYTGIPHEVAISATEEPDELEWLNLRNLFDGGIDTKWRYSVSEITIQDRLGIELRSRVFTKMPIRMLFFETRGSNLQITLIERSEIVSLFEPKLRRILQSEAPDLDLYETDTGSWTDHIQNMIKMETKYAILSHTWLHSTPGEVTYNDWTNKRFNSNDTGYQKLVNFCRTAWEHHNVSLGWMDTVCINKDSSSELDESIRSMYNWYNQSGVCIVYLSKTSIIPNIHCDPWFTRGWTLQELLAPTIIKFYNQFWVQFEDSWNDKPLGSRWGIQVRVYSKQIMEQIQQATTLNEKELSYYQRTPFSRRMELAAKRKVTREEDMAYSLMGIFDVSIATAYGEGSSRAFLRLLQEIFNSEKAGVLDLLNWSGCHDYSKSRVLPCHPMAYLTRDSSIRLNVTPRSQSLFLNLNLQIIPVEPPVLTNFGVRIPVILMPATEDTFSQFKARGDYSATVTIKNESPSGEGKIETYRLLDSTASGQDGRRHTKDGGYIHQYTFAIFNIQRDNGGGIYIPQTCIAIILQCNEKVGKVTTTGTFARIDTEEPVVFRLQRRNILEKGWPADDFVDVDHEGIVIAEEDLAKHGMQLVIKYL
ncbi:hypothetical protein BDN70DRAFT_991412 [Pholiota conissans]|uniref:Heterokaryon incompatibility domain-containing protein n=1 Tax=Pholiota conissans TaxID=109636 RepID=A0A9P5Z6S8_9AGAR|nr:hypothetical protein BDN70DRAFT_991412 [Pholiota conissans]